MIDFYYYYYFFLGENGGLIYNIKSLYINNSWLSGTESRGSKPYQIPFITQIQNWDRSYIETKSVVGGFPALPRHPCTYLLHDTRKAPELPSPTP